MVLFIMFSGYINESRVLGFIECSIFYMFFRIYKRHIIGFKNYMDSAFNLGILYDYFVFSRQCI